ncbi:MAG TPA: mycofactocin system FadH/OYE family oxidoreductase 2 [Acidimicrobiales bacterium]|nr:mycofactocin system FadH/OYE family oxidoreductase 2 [Acidimicrobiales bacterium]
MSATGRYRLLFTPLALGPVVVRNRIVFSAHLTNYAQDGAPSEQHTAYYEARAAGGAGLIVTEEHSTHPTDWPYEKMIHGFDPAVIPGYRRITDAVHRHGTPIFAQINHNGGQGSSMYSRLPLWAPSPVADPLFREVPKAVDAAEIDEIVDGYARVAGHCVEGGFDGIELQCSHSSIVRGFLSPATNRRTDDYGGSLENRSRLLLRLVAAVRRTVGGDVALGVRLCGDELIEGGTTLEDALWVARALEATGAVDYLNTSIGVATATLYMIEASMQVPPAYALWIASALRKAVSLPVIGVGRFKDPLQADRALRDGHADLIGVVRGQIADPDFAAKARAGHASWIRACLSCNQECVGRMGLNRWLGCIENPRAGREAIALAAPPSARRRVVVVGAGAGGMQAAIAAARRGHQVDLYEAQDQPGGQVRVAASVPSRAELGDLVRNQLAEASRLGVRFHFGQRADADLVVAAGADAVVVATGALPERPWWAGTAARVLDVREVLEARASPAGRVLVVDELGFHQATSVAELLADRGCALEVVTPAMVVGQDLGVTLDQETWWMKAAARGISETTDTIVTGLVEREDGALSVELQQHTTGLASERVVDWVVCASPPRPDDGLWRELRDRLAPGIALERVGDCVAPRRAHAAVIEGDRVGASL